MGFDRYAIGNTSACTCGSGACTPSAANNVLLAVGKAICVCNACVGGGAPTTTFTLNAAVGGVTVIPLSYTATIWSSSCLADGSGGSWKISFEPGTTYWKITVSHYSDAACVTGVGGFTINGTGTDLTAYQFEAPISATFQVTAGNCSFLHNLGVTSIVFAGVDGDPLCVTGLTTCSNLPLNLVITDVLGTYTALYNGSQWWTAQLKANSTSPLADCTGGSPACGVGVMGNPAYAYAIAATGAGLMQINRYWTELTCPPVEYGPFGCAGVGSGTSSVIHTGSGNISVTCGAIAWSGTLGGSTGTLADPVGGTVSFTQ